VAALTVTFRVRDPVGANDLYRTTRTGIMYKPKEIKDYQARVKQWAWLAAQTARWPNYRTVKRVRLSYDLHSNHDADAALKPTMDALQKCLYVNDNCVEVGALRAFRVKRGQTRSIVIQVELLEVA
jgi:hypothetical protein